MVFSQIQSDNFEQIIFCNDASVGLKGIIALHSTALGPAVGGCRMWNYKDESEALYDVLRLSKGMTYKAAISGLDWGGGKSIIWGDPKTKSHKMLERFGEYINKLGGNYVTAKDVGIGSEDLMQIKDKTPHVLGIDGTPGSSGDPSPATAWGVYHGMKSSAKAAFGTDSLNGLRVAMQGLGSVAYYLAEHLIKEGATVIGCDVDQKVIDRAKTKFGMEIVDPKAIYDVKCDIFSPNALGATINPETRARIKSKVIAGAANNQLATMQDGIELSKAGVVYAPDYAINAGGLMNIYHESSDRGGYNQARAFDHIAQIGQTIAKILERAKAENQCTALIADRMAEERVAAARARKR